jgi:hypothetical protein
MMKDVEGMITALNDCEGHLENRWALVERKTGIGLMGRWNQHLLRKPVQL